MNYDFSTYDNYGHNMGKNKISTFFKKFKES